MASIYLVDGDWYDFEDRGHWTVAAFTTFEAAERHRENCQAWADRYMQDFWNAWAAEYGEPKERGRFGVSYSDCSEEEADRKMDFVDRWFGRVYHRNDDESTAPVLDTTCGLAKMRQLSPDPRVEMNAGIPCSYSVVAVPVNPTERTEAVELGPKRGPHEFEQRYCEFSNITPEFYAKNLVTLRCCCDDPDCPGWAAVNNDPEAVERHNELYGLTVMTKQ